MDLIAQAPAVHTRRRSRWNPSAVDKSIAMGLAASRGTPRTMPIFHAGEPIALVRGDVEGHRSLLKPITWRQWCGFTGYADLNSEMKNGKWMRTLMFKDTSGGHDQGVWMDLWSCQGRPNNGSFTGTANSLRAFSNTSVGAPYTDSITPSGGDTRHLAGWTIALDTAATVCNLILYDRVATYEGSTVTTSTTTFTNTTPAARYISAGQEGLLVTAFIQTTTGATAGNLTTLTFTDQNGNTGVTQTNGSTIEWWTGEAGFASTAGAPLAWTLGSAFPLRACPWMGLAANCSGVRKLETSISSATNTGTIYWVLLHPIGTLWTQGQVITNCDLARSTFALERVFTDACLAVMMHQESVATTSARFNLKLVHG
jgi:hypothetical protein